MKGPIRPAFLAIAAASLAACATSVAPSSSDAAPPGAEASRVGMPNPASVHCRDVGGRLEIRTGRDGGQYGMCMLPDGRACEEWALFRDGKCTPSEAEAPAAE